MDQKQQTLLLDVKPSFIIIVPHVLLCFVLIGFITIWKPLIALLSTRLTVTNFKVEGKVGLIKTKTMDSPVRQVTSVSIYQGLIAKIFNYGTVTINTANGVYTFKYMPDPKTIKMVIDNAIYQAQ